MSTLRASLLTLTRTVLRGFFRSIQVQGLENVPQDRGGILISWHVSGVVDPAILVATFPQQVAFGARHGLLRIPLIGRLMREMGTVPIYRAADLADLPPEQRRARNAGSLDALAHAVAEGRFAALFPEGDTHDNPFLSPVKSGAARFYYRARQLAREQGPQAAPDPSPAPPPAILPVGLFYDDKTLWRSDVLVRIHPPLELPPELDFDPAPDAPPESWLEPARALRDQMREALTQAVHATESWELHRLMERAAEIVAVEQALEAGQQPRRSAFPDRVQGMGRIWSGYQSQRETHPERIAALRRRMEVFDQQLRALDLQVVDLERDPELLSPSLIFLLLLQLAGLVLVMPPLLVLGLVVNWPATALGWLATRRFSRSPRDDATVKIMLGTLTYPLSWLGAGLGAWRFADWVRDHVDGMPDAAWLVGVLVGVLGMLGGMALLRYVRGVREAWRGLRVRILRARAKVTLADLRVERRELYEELLELQD